MSKECRPKYLLELQRTPQQPGIIPRSTDSHPDPVVMPVGQRHGTALMHPARGRRRVLRHLRGPRHVVKLSVSRP
jgi:hypothetical protein